VLRLLQLLAANMANAPLTMPALAPLQRHSLVTPRNTSDPKALQGVRFMFYPALRSVNNRYTIQHKLVSDWGDAGSRDGKKTPD
jgi:hypothetical protein